MLLDKYDNKLLKKTSDFNNIKYSLLKKVNSDFFTNLKFICTHRYCFYKQHSITYLFPNQ